MLLLTSSLDEPCLGLPEILNVRSKFRSDLGDPSNIRLLARCLQCGNKLLCHERQRPQASPAIPTSHLRNCTLGLDHGCPRRGDPAKTALPQRPALGPVREPGKGSAA